jgi:hypothetical protein
MLTDTVFEMIGEIKGEPSLFIRMVRIMFQTLGFVRSDFLYKELFKAKNWNIPCFLYLGDINVHPYPFAPIPVT